MNRQGGRERERDVKDKGTVINGKRKTERKGEEQLGMERERNNEKGGEKGKWRNQEKGRERKT
jgi:hypothetical protein